MHVIRRNGKLMIKARHHRFFVAKALGLSVKYIVCDDQSTIHELEQATNPWDLKDYLVSYDRCGYAPYGTVMRYQARTGIPLMACISMLGGQSAGSNNKVNAFKDGRFELGDPTHSEIVADIILHCKKKCKIPWVTNTMFVKAVSKVTWVEEFQPSHLKKKISTFPFLLEKKPDVASYVEMLEQVYNRQNKNPIPLAFLAEQTARARFVHQQTPGVSKSKPKLET
jgi:hypothetical protein